MQTETATTPSTDVVPLDTVVEENGTPVVESDPVEQTDGTTEEGTTEQPTNQLALGSIAIQLPANPSDYKSPELKADKAALQAAAEDPAVAAFLASFIEDDATGNTQRAEIAIEEMGSRLRLLVAGMAATYRLRVYGHGVNSHFFNEKTKESRGMNGTLVALTLLRPALNKKYKKDASTLAKML